MFSVRTDLAIENREAYKKSMAAEAPGVDVDNEEHDGINITRVKINTQEGEQAIGKAMGTYITLEVKDLKDDDSDLGEKTSMALAGELKKLIKGTQKDSVLVVGLGNWNVTPDALGPKVVSYLDITRHLVEYMPEHIDENTRPVSALAPGVLGTTGIETGEIIKGVVEKTKPNLVIAIDALASRRLERISTTIQIADTGINPGSGVGNKRQPLSFETLGVPVIAIGIPTVVDAATMANDAIDLMIDNMQSQVTENKELYDFLQKMNKQDKYDLIKSVLSPYVGNLVVTPKEIDSIISNVSEIVANGINYALNESLYVQ